MVPNLISFCMYAHLSCVSSSFIVVNDKKGHAHERSAHVPRRTATCRRAVPAARRAVACEVEDVAADAGRSQIEVLRRARDVRQRPEPGAVEAEGTSACVIERAQQIVGGVAAAAGRCTRLSCRRRKAGQHDATHRTAAVARRYTLTALAQRLGPLLTQSQRRIGAAGQGAALRASRGRAAADRADAGRHDRAPQPGLEEQAAVQAEVGSPVSAARALVNHMLAFHTPLTCHTPGVRGKLSVLTRV